MAGPKRSLGWCLPSKIWFEQFEQSKLLGFGLSKCVLNHRMLDLIYQFLNLTSKCWSWSIKLGVSENRAYQTRSTWLEVDYWQDMKCSSIKMAEKSCINLPGPFLAMCSTVGAYLWHPMLKVQRQVPNHRTCKIHNGMRNGNGFPDCTNCHCHCATGSIASQDKSLWVNQRLKGTYRNFWSCLRECLTPWSSFLTSYYLLMIFEYVILKFQTLSNNVWMFGVFLSSSCVCVCVFVLCFPSMCLTP